MAGGQPNSSVWVKTPKTSTANLDLPNYGLSFLFIKTSTTSTTVNIKAVITATV